MTLDNPAMKTIENKKTVKDIVVEGTPFTYIKTRLVGGKVFAAQDKSTYLRTGELTEITGEVTLTKDLFTRGFPVPEIVGTGTLEDGTPYYIEKSIGQRVCADMFIEETKTRGHASEESFNAFISVIKKYCAAQFNPENFIQHDQAALEKVTALANVLRNNPPSAEMQPLFTEAYKKASERVKMLPWGYVQADLNAFNILPEGIIDFELAGFGPVGYDILTNVYFERMWPAKHVIYMFTDEQIAQYVRAVDTIAIEHGLPPMSSFANDFLVLKAIWASSKDKESEDNPTINLDFWQWRANMRDWCIKQYLKGEDIDTNKFEEVATAV